MAATTSKMEDMTEDEARTSLKRAFESDWRRFDEIMRTQGPQGLPEGDPILVSHVFDVCEAYPSLALDGYPCGPGVVLATPLEYFLLRQVSVAAIKEFCVKFPESLAGKSPLKSGDLPLHLVYELYISSTCDLVPLMASKFPEAVSMPNHRGDLPLHALLYNLNGSDVTPGKIREIEALIHIFPQSVAIAAPSTGAPPINTVLTQRNSPEVLQCLVNNFPKGATDTFHYIRGATRQGLHAGPLTIEHSKAFCPLLSQLRSLNFPLNETTFTAEAATHFLQSLASCPELQRLEMELSSDYLVNEPVFLAAVVETVQRLTALESLILSFSTNNLSNQRSIFSLAESLAQLLERGSLVELILKEGIEINPEPIMRAITHRVESSLDTVDIRCFNPNFDMTQLLADVIAANTSVRSLSLKYATFDTQPVFQAVARNTRLTSLALPDIISTGTNANTNTNSNDNPDFETLSSVLQKYNTMLKRIRCHRASFQELQESDYQNMQYYARLNHVGRGQTRGDTFKCTDLIKLLLGLDCRDDELLGLYFGLLRECPTTWSSSR